MFGVYIYIILYINQQTKLGVSLRDIILIQTNFLVCQCFPSSTCHQLGQIPIFGPDWNAHVQQEHHHTNFSGLRLVFRRFSIVLAGILRCPLTSVHFKHLGIVWVVADRHDELMLQPDFHILYIYSYIYTHLEPRCRKIKGTTFFPAKKVTTMMKKGLKGNISWKKDQRFVAVFVTSWSSIKAEHAVRVKHLNMKSPNNNRVFAFKMNNNTKTHEQVLAESFWTLLALFPEFPAQIWEFPRNPQTHPSTNLRILSHGTSAWKLCQFQNMSNIARMPNSWKKDEKGTNLKKCTTWKTTVFSFVLYLFLGILWRL